MPRFYQAVFLRLLTSRHVLSTTPQGDEGLNFSDEPITNCDWSLDSGLDLFFQVTFFLMMLQGEFFVVRVMLAHCP